MKRTLLVSVYVWFLTAIVLTIATVAAFMLLFGDDPRRAQEQVIERVSTMRDVVQRVMAKGVATSDLDELVGPIVESFRATVTVIDARDHEMWRLSAKKPEAAPAPVDRALVERMKRDGSAVVFGAGREVTAAIPITLPGGDAGVFYAQVRGPRPQWQRSEEAGQRLAFGLGVILIIGFALSFVLARSITAPLASMATAADRFGSGDLAARMPELRSEELRRVGDSFNRMADRISRLIEDKRRLLADISHELKTPLSRLRLSLELARGGGGEQAFLDKSDKQVEQLASLIDELLMYSRLEAQPYSAERTQNDVAALVADVAMDARVERDVAPGLTFALDRRLMARALGNVVENALSHTTGPVTVHASLDGPTLVLAVEDRGPGVKAEDRVKIFEAFYRTDDSRARDKGGHGLGLAIAKRCVEAHGGTVIAEAACPDGSGLRVVLRLPP